MKSHRVWAGLFVALALAACDDATAPDTGDDLEAGVADFGAEGDFGLFGPGGRGLRGPGPMGLLGLRFPPLDGELPDCPEHAPRCPGDHGNGDQANRDRGDFDRQVTFFDANGDVQDAFDEESTASVHFLVSGSFAGEGPRGGTLEATGSRDLWATGIQDGTGTVTWSGTDDHVRAGSHEGDGGTMSIRREAHTRVNDVVVPHPREEGQWPLSGSITTETSLEIVGGPRGDRDESHTVTVVFSGTSVVTVVLDGEERTVDLEELRERRRNGPPGGPGGGAGGWRNR